MTVRARMGSLLVAGVAFIGTPALADAEFSFIDLAPIKGIEAYHVAFGIGSGVAAADYDDDGDIDLFIPNGDGFPDQLYKNDGTGNFQNVASQVGVNSVENSRGAVWFDYDADGDLDLLVVRDSYAQSFDLPDTFKLWEQSAGFFVDATEDAGLTGQYHDFNATHTGGITAGDLNADGYPDFIYCGWLGSTHVFESDTNGGFIDVTEISGVEAGNAWAWQPMIHDFNEDGLNDIFVNVDFGPNHLWQNRGNGRFDDIAPNAGVNTFWNEMGMHLNDFDNDGLFDIYITNITRFEVEPRHNRFYHNTSFAGIPVFFDRSVELGVEDTYWGWGCTMFDADRDGWVDIAATNGFDVVSEPEWLTDPSRFFLNPTHPGDDGNGPFLDVSDTVGFNDIDWGSGLVAADLDRDGDADLVQVCNLGAPVRVLYNFPTGQAAANHYLVIKPRMEGPNTHAIGAIVRVTSSDKTMSRLITAGNSFLGQEPYEAFFGMGTDLIAAVVTVEWPNGEVTELTDVAVDQVITVMYEAMVECPEDLDQSGSVDFNDLLAILGAWGPCEGCPEDLNDDGVISFGDILALLGAWGPCPG